MQDSPSTGILNGIQSVQVDYSKDTASKHAAGFDPNDKVDTKCKWTKTVFKISSLIEFGRYFQEKKKLPSDEDSSTNIHSSMDATNTTAMGSLAQTTTTETAVAVRSDTAREEAVQHAQYLNKMEYSQIRSSLENTHSLYLSDTGGQIEFQELLPLLIAGPAIFIFVFRLHPDGLNVLTKVSYRKGQNEETNEYKSSLTIREFFLQTLASINSMELNTVNDFRKDKKFKPCVIIVGTFKDELQELLDHNKVIKDINNEIKAIVEKHEYKNIIFCPVNGNSGEYFFAISNKSDANLPDDQEGDGGKIRSFITDWIKSEDMFEIEYPLHYLLASLFLESLNKEIITKEFFADSLKENRIEIEEMDHLLCFLHYNIGQIRHFPKCKKLKDLIFNKPTLLFDAVTELIIMTFLKKRAGHRQLSELEKGIISDDYIRKNIRLPESITHDVLVEALMELRIVAPYEDHDKSKKFFISCILNHLPVHELEQAQQKPELQTLVIEFQCKHIPKGLFGILIHCIITREPEPVECHEPEPVMWMLDPKEIFRDEVSFKALVGPHFNKEVNFDKITLRFFSTHLEIFYLPANDRDDFELTTKDVCSNARSILESAINKAARTLRYNPVELAHKYKFKCVKSECQRLNEIKLKPGPEACEFCKQPTSPSVHHWFGSTRKY